MKFSPLCIAALLTALFLPVAAIAQSSGSVSAVLAGVTISGATLNLGGNYPSYSTNVLSNAGLTMGSAVITPGTLAPDGSTYITAQTYATILPLLPSHSLSRFTVIPADTATVNSAVVKTGAGTLSLGNAAMLTTGGSIYVGSPSNVIGVSTVNLNSSAVRFSSGVLTSGVLIVNQPSLTTGGVLSLGNSGGTTMGGTVIPGNPSDLADYYNLSLNSSVLGTSGATLTLNQPQIPVGGTLLFGNSNTVLSGGSVIGTGHILGVSTNSAIVRLSGGTLALAQPPFTISSALSRLYSFGTLNLNASQREFDVTSGSSLRDLPSFVNQINGSRLTFLDGTAQASGRFSIQYLPAVAQLASDAVELHMGTLTGGSGDKFVLQLSYDPALAAALGSLSNLYLGWFDPADNTWKNAIAGNSDGGVGASFVNGAYNSATDFQLSRYGVDTANHVAWAVVDHNSIFGVGNSSVLPAVPAPEPGSVLLLVGGAGLLLARRRRIERP